MSDDEDNRIVEKFLLKYKFPLILLLIGIILIGCGVIYYKSHSLVGNDKIQVIENVSSDERNSKIVVEVAGAVINPGVFEFEGDARVDDAINKAGGFSSEADSEWIEKHINRAAKLVDGQKLYITRMGEQSDVLSANDSSGGETISNDISTSTSGLININSGSQKELESLWGIGPVYATNIIEHRPYSSLEELVQKSIIRSSTFEKIKNQLTI